MSTSFERLQALPSPTGKKRVGLAPGSFRAKCRWTILAASAALTLSASTTAFAADDARGGGVLGRANTAWGRGEFDVAEALYHEALEQGGLSRSDTLKAYVYMACARAVQGKREQALSAFRQAVLIDPRFTLPPEAGKKALALGEQVRAKEGKVGPFVMAAEIPSHADSGSSFSVRLSMDASRAALLTRVGLTVTDGLGTSPYEYEQDVPPNDGDAPVKMKFDVPAKMAMPGSELKIKLAGLDPHNNELVTAEGHTTIGGTAAVASSGDALPHKNEEPEKKKGGGFWSSPVPYVLAGLAVAGAGVGVYFATRPGDQVSLAAVKVQTQ